MDLGFAALLFGVALAVRWPHLMSVPAFSDEGLEVGWALDIARGVHLPLTAYDPYDGPLFPYLIAAAFRLFGTGMIVPRAVIAVLSALTVPATFWLGTVVAGRWAGAIAAIGVIACPALVLFSSHYAWSNSLTPIFATLTLACVYTGATQENRTALTAGGLLAALTLQTHPIAGVAVVAVGLWLLRARRWHPWITGRELRRPAIAFVVGYSPMLVANLIHPLVGLRVGLTRTYAAAPTLRPGEFAARVVDLVRTLVDAVAGGLAFEQFPAQPVAVAAVVVVLGGALIVDWRRGDRFLTYVLSVSALTIPLVVKLFVPRYLLFLVPALFVVIAVAIVRFVSSRAALAVVVVLALATQVYAAARTERYVEGASARGLTNDAYFRLRAAIEDRHACGERLFVEDVGRPLRDPAWVGLYAVDYVLTLTGCQHQLLTVDRISGAAAAGGEVWAVLSSTTAARWPAPGTLALEYSIGAPAGQDLLQIGLYRLARGGRP